MSPDYAEIVGDIAETAGDGSAYEILRVLKTKYSELELKKAFNQIWLQPKEEWLARIKELAPKALFWLLFYDCRKDMGSIIPIVPNERIQHNPSIRSTWLYTSEEGLRCSTKAYEALSDRRISMHAGSYQRPRFYLRSTYDSALEDALNISKRYSATNWLTPLKVL